MPYVSVHVDVDDVLGELDDDEIRQELTRREAKNAPSASKALEDGDLLEQIYQHFRSIEAPWCLREYIYRKLGRCL